MPALAGGAELSSSWNDCTWRPGGGDRRDSFRSSWLGRRFPHRDQACSASEGASIPIAQGSARGGEREMVRPAILMALLAASLILQVSASRSKRLPVRAPDKGKDLPNRCDPFRPSVRQVLVWFKSAKRIKHSTWREADRSQCLAQGTQTGSDGRQYTWELDQAGLAIVMPAGGDRFCMKGAALPFRTSL